MLFETGKVYSFNTIAPITLNNYENVKNVGILDFDLAVNFEDIVGIHEKVKEETGKNIKGLETSKFYVFKGPNDEKIILSDLWVVPDSIKIITALDLLVKIKGVKDTDKPIIQNILRKAGYINVEITEV
jgi:hypothetical protein